MRDFVPEVDGAGFVADEHDGPFFGIGEGFEDVQAGVGGVEQEDIVISLTYLCGFIYVAQGNKGEDLHREFGGGGKGLEFLLNPLLFFGYVVLVVDAAPGSPARLFAGLEELDGEDGLDA